MEPASTWTADLVCLVEAKRLCGNLTLFFYSCFLTTTLFNPTFVEEPHQVYVEFTREYKTAYPTQIKCAI